MIEDFMRNKIRTFLTSLGILIGVGSVVMLISFGLGLKKYISNQFESLGTNLILILPGNIIQNGRFSSGGPSSLGGTVSFDKRDYVRLKRIREAQHVVPIYTRSVRIEYGNATEVTSIFGTTADIFPVRNLVALYGRVFEPTEVTKRSKVVVIGPKIAKKLFGDIQNGIGKTVKINSLRFRVVGILEGKGGGGFGGPDLDSFVYMPLETANVFNTDKTYYTFYIKAKRAEDIPEIKRKAEEALLMNHEKEDFSVAEQTEILNAISSIFSILNIVLVAIAAISLVVGGIGIMNIMYVSVVERIREIGIRRAVGARKRDILLQFIAESVLLSVFGGLLGLLLAYGVVSLAQRYFPAYINLESVLIAIGVSSFIGITFGVFPAKKASDLSPIEAIRYE